MVSSGLDTWKPTWAQSADGTSSTALTTPLVAPTDLDPARPEPDPGTKSPRIGEPAWRLGLGEVSPGVRGGFPAGDGQGVAKGARVSENVLELTDQSWEAEVVKSAKPVLVDFWAEWCVPCKTLSPTVEAVAGGPFRDLLWLPLPPDHA